MFYELFVVGLHQNGHEAADGGDRWTVWADVDGRGALPVCSYDNGVDGHKDDFVLAESGSNSVFVLGIGNLVGYDGDLTLAPFSRDENSALADIDRAWRGLDDDERRVDRLFGEAGERSYPGFEIGDDDGVGFWYGAKQLLSG